MSLPDLRALLALLSEAGVGDLDVIRILPGVPDYASLAADADRFDLDGLTVAIASRGKLIEMKQARDNEQDRADIAALRALEDR